MAQTIYTRALVDAAEAHGSTQALASFLRVPENTLLRWMAGRAQMPLQAFLKVIEFLAQYEKTESAAPATQAPADRLQFSMGELQARCPCCDAAEFVPATAGAPLRYTSELLCVSCGERVIHAGLICQLARDAIHHSRGAAKPTASTRPAAKG